MHNAVGSVDSHASPLVMALPTHVQAPTLALEGTGVHVLKSKLPKSLYSMHTHNQHNNKKNVDPFWALVSKVPFHSTP